MTLSLNLIDFVLSALALQGFVITGLLFYSSKTIVSNRWLGALVFIVSYWVLNVELARMGILARYPLSLVLLPQFTFAAGPIVYFYAKSLIIGPQKIKGKNWLHFLPLVAEFKPQLIFLIYTSGLLYIPLLQNLYFKPLTQHILFNSNPGKLILVSITAYATATYVIIIKHQKSVVLPANKLKDLKWLKTILNAVFVIVVLLFYGWDRPSIGQYVTLLPLVVAIYVLGMAAWRRQAHMSIDEKQEYTQKPAKVHFAQEEADVYTRRLKELMVTQQLYLNPVLKVEDVAAEMLISEKALSNLINQYLGKNFNDYVNEYRIAEAKQQLVDPKNRNFTIAAIAFDCGFNSLTTFQRVFKQIAGTTPSRYQHDNFSSQLAIK
ncbi:helix-turn-helix transcriptional regulator [Mucilaginibacter sp. dw_454]|uniref:helix-turn-helix domain-containing protein n=1 Tax=Mucilaginibacter sp. dw_454 TaxID=2720079 RepID=UPI001BD627DE|nr:helix-turn-helix transcriptional regulator [Mucilaginibacter sp. dw_454]